MSADGVFPAATWTTIPSFRSAFHLHIRTPDGRGGVAPRGVTRGDGPVTAPPNHHRPSRRPRPRHPRRQGCGSARSGGRRRLVQRDEEAAFRGLGRPLAPVPTVAAGRAGCVRRCRGGGRAGCAVRSPVRGPPDRRRARASAAADTLANPARACSRRRPSRCSRDATPLPRSPGTRRTASPSSRPPRASPVSRRPWRSSGGCGPSTSSDPRRPRLRRRPPPAQRHPAAAAGRRARRHPEHPRTTAPQRRLRRRARPDPRRALHRPRPCPPARHDHIVLSLPCPYPRGVARWPADEVAARVR